MGKQAKQLTERPAIGGRASAAEQPAEGWVLSRICMAREIAAKLHDLSGPSRTGSDLQEGVKEIRDLMDTLEGEAWEQYINTHCLGRLEQEAIRSIGPPDLVIFDQKEGRPVALWNRHSEGGTGYAVRAAEATKGSQNPRLKTPFREVVVGSLPEESKILPITDSLHASSAALAEILEAALSDASAFMKEDAREAWKLMRYQADFYAAAARISLKTMPRDQFRDWKEQVPSAGSVSELPVIIGKTAVTSRAQQAVGLRCIADMYAAVMDGAERKFKEPKDRVAHVHAWLQKNAKMMAVVRDGYARVLLALEGIEWDEVMTMTIMRLMPNEEPSVVVLGRHEDNVATIK